MQDLNMEDISMSEIVELLEKQKKVFNSVYEKLKVVNEIMKMPVIQEIQKDISELAWGQNVQDIGLKMFNLEVYRMYSSKEYEYQIWIPSEGRYCKLTLEKIKPESLLSQDEIKEQSVETKKYFDSISNYFKKLWDKQQA